MGIGKRGPARSVRKRDRAHSNVVRWVARSPVTEIGTSVLVLAEIRHGIELKRRSDPEQAKALDRWFSQMRTRLGDRVLPIDKPIAVAWALMGIPNPLPLIDGLLASTAKVQGLTLDKRLCLSEIKSGHIRDAIRRGPVGKECALPTLRCAVAAAHPCPRPSACASHYYCRERKISESGGSLSRYSAM